MASRILAPFPYLDPGPWLQASSVRAPAETSGGQGIITEGVFLENASGDARRADDATVETTVLGYCTKVFDSNLQPLAKGQYLSNDEAGWVEYIPDATLLANLVQFVIGEDGVTSTVQAFINAGNTIAAGIYAELINTGQNSLVDDMARYGADASRQKIVQVTSGASLATTQGTLPFKLVKKYSAGKAVADDPTATDSAAADWVWIRVNA